MRRTIPVGISCLVLVLAVRTAFAQDGASSAQAPTIAGGSLAEISSSGMLSASIPLDLPKPRGEDLPVPVSVVHTGGFELDAVGVGWTVPLSVIELSDSHAHRKPQASATTTSVAPRIVLSLLGESWTLAQTGTTSSGIEEYRPILAQAPLFIEKEIFPGKIDWRVRDGHGRTYHFWQLHEDRSRDKRAFLSSIDDAHGNRVSLFYSVKDVPWPISYSSSEPVSQQVSLLRVQYSYATVLQGYCPKHEIELRYAQDDLDAFGLAVRNGLRVAQRDLLKEIIVWVNSDNGCLDTPTRLRTYTFYYSASRDTGRKRPIDPIYQGAPASGTVRA